jgi:hypothetical protein
MEGNCEACAWIDRAQSGAISRDLAQVPRSPRGAERRRKAEAEAESRCRAAYKLHPRCDLDHICGPGYSHASLCIVARSRPVSIAASTQTFADCDRPVGTWPAACQFDRVDLPST